MAILKAIEHPSKEHGGMRNVIEYVLQDKKIPEKQVDLLGPGPAENLSWDNVYKAFLEVKKAWGKDDGRMYAHEVISFHHAEQITPAMALDFGREFAEKTFPDHQVLLSVHQDREHLHVHMVINSVAFSDGKKLHTTKHDLENQKQIVNTMCREHGLSVAEKGKHFDGSQIEEGTVKSWKKNEYQILSNNAKKSYLVTCGTAVMDAMDHATCREEFVREMRASGWSVVWTDTRKHITFEDENGNRVRDSKLSKTFTLNISKEALELEFERKKKERTELDAYYSELRALGSGLDTPADGDDTDAVIRKAEAARRAAEDARRESEAAASAAKHERRSREAARERQRAAERKGNTGEKLPYSC